MEESVDRDGHYTVAETARILKRTQPQVRRLVNTGGLASVREGERVFIPREAVHERLTALRLAGQTPESATRINEGLAISLGRERMRRELTSYAESTMREEMQRLRDDLDAERERRIEAETELRWYRKSAWKRLFGG